MAEINAAREPDVDAALKELDLSARKNKLVRSALMGHHGDRIIAAHGGSVLEAARSVAGVDGAANRAHLANLACPHCGHPIAPRTIAAAMGAAGRGASKRRNVDYSALARASHATRAANKEKSAGA